MDIMLGEGGWGAGVSKLLAMFVYSCISSQHRHVLLMHLIDNECLHVCQCVN